MVMTPRKIRALGTDVDALTLVEATTRIIEWLKATEQSPVNAHEVPCRYVVTPNLDHAVMLQENQAFAQSYANASLVLADGMPLVWASKLSKTSLPARVAGSDLVPAVLSACPRKTRVYFLGAREEASKRAVENVLESYPQVEIVGRMSPPLGFENSREWNDRIISDIKNSRAQLIVVGLGAPKQELWVHHHSAQLSATVALCVGATIDFLAGTVHRAPQWTHALGLEWLHRLASDPRRLTKRYAKDAFCLPKLLLDDARERRKGV